VTKRETMSFENGGFGNNLDQYFKHECEKKRAGNNEALLRSACAALEVAGWMPDDVAEWWKTNKTVSRAEQRRAEYARRTKTPR